MQRCVVDCIGQFVRSGCKANTHCTMAAAQKQRLHMQALFLLADAPSAYPPHARILLTDDTEYKALLTFSGRVPADNPS